MVIYTPALAMETTTGIDVWTCVWLTGGICIFYTSIGGKDHQNQINSIKSLLLMEYMMQADNSDLV
jgi:Na+/proline symporter